VLRVLITGTNSFIGSNFRKYSKYREYEEVSLVNKDPEEIDFIKFDIVLHLAAIVHQSRKISDEHYYRVNTDLCLRVAKAAKKAGIKQFVFLSTLKVYGELVKGDKVRNEKSECYPSDSYGKSKYEAELGLLEIADKNFIVSIIRSSLVYGENVKANMMSLIKLVDYCPVLPFGNANNMRNFIYVENLIAYIDIIIEKRMAGIFLALDDKAISTKQLVIYISKYLQKKRILLKLPHYGLKLWNLLSPGTYNRLFGSLEFDNTRTTLTLDFNAPFTSEEGIRRMVLAYLHRKNKSSKKSCK